MAEYIEKETARAELIIHDELYAADIVKAIPAADVVEVKHGEWIFGVTMHHEWMKCSVCNVSQDLNGCFSYCPNCGAKMEV